MTSENLPNLLIATDNFLPRRDGITRFLSTVLPHLSKNFNITIICPDYGAESITMENITFVKIPMTNNLIGDFKPSTFQWRKIKKTIPKADIIFTQTIGPIGAIALYLGYKKNKKVIAFTHSIEWQLISQSIQSFLLKKLFSPITKWFTKFLYNRCSYLIVPSERIADFLSWENISTGKKVIHLGVDTKKFIPYYENEKRNLIRETYGILEDEIVIGYHGRISHEKDLKTLVRAYIVLRKKIPNAKLLIVGSGIKSIVESLMKQAGVIYIPEVSNVENFVSAMDIYCLPSLTETTSLSTLEAMSCSLPIVSTGAGFIKDYILNGKNGYLFTKKDSFDLAKKLEKLCKNKDLRIEFGKTSRQIAEKQFQWEATEKKLTEFLLSQVPK
jgi:glycosyltransferase involved in cell wall biosynthesis